MQSDQQYPATADVVTLDGMRALIESLRCRGFRTIGPTMRDQAIVYDDIESIDDLPRGWTDEQDGGRYRLLRRGDDALFGYAVGPQSWKQYLHPPRLRLWRARREGHDVHLDRDAPPAEHLAFIGVRACELRAIKIQDRVFLDGPYRDPHYEARRENVFIVAVNCGKAGGTCFCASMNAGPKVSQGFDLAITELIGGEPAFLVEAGSKAGHEILNDIPHRAATKAEIDEAEAIVAKTAAGMGREMRSDDLHGLLMNNLEHPRWDDVASRCLSCANCTMVCPTCFCTSVEDASDLDGAGAERWRRWDSCFTMDFSYIHGGSVRASARARYRQWMTHKLATWFDQFGSSGCVGCGRCITWCPVGIDITEEARAIRTTGATTGESS